MISTVVKNIFTAVKDIFTTVKNIFTTEKIIFTTVKNIFTTEKIISTVVKTQNSQAAINFLLTVFFGLIISFWFLVNSFFWFNN
jgi:hypothetical protein